MGPPTTPAILPIPPTDPTSQILLQTSNGTKTFDISPTSRPAFSNMPTPETPYGRLLNVMSSYYKIVTIDSFFAL